MDTINKIENIVIDNKKIQTQIKELNIFEISYFLENPRINYMMGKVNTDISQDDIDKNLWRLESVKKLYEDIERNGGLLEEIIVVDGKVVEGNSRLCAYRHLFLNAKEEEKDKWKYIRAKVILESLSSKELFLLLGKLHITGKTEWDPFEIANYIYKTIKVDELSIKEVAKMLGMQVSTIETKLKAYNLMNDKYLPSLPSTEIAADHLNKYSIFEEYYKSSELQKLTKEASEIVTDDKFVDWVVEGRIKSAVNDVRQCLPKILIDKKARKTFIGSDSLNAIEDSRKVLYEDKPEENNNTLKRIKDMTDFLKSIEIGKFKNNLNSNERAFDVIKKLRSAVKELCNNLGIDNLNKDQTIKLSRKRKIRLV